MSLYTIRAPGIKNNDSYHKGVFFFRNLAFFQNFLYYDFCYARDQLLRIVIVLANILQ